MAYNHGREDRKWRIWKEAEEKVLREHGVDEAVIEQIRMYKDGYEAAKHRAKYRCPKSNRKRGCFCEHPCLPAKYGRTVHIFTDDNPRLFNIPPRDSKAWEKEYDRRTSVERSNKREKEDYKLEDGRHRSTKMWYCRLYGIMMLQHLDAWEMPSAEAFQESLLGLTA